MLENLGDRPHGNPSFGSAALKPTHLQHVSHLLSERLAKVVVETLLKLFTLIFTPVAERISNTLKRKPKLHIYVRPLTTFWCYAGDGSPMMQVVFTADITNDSHDESVIVLDGYFKGTKPQIPFRARIEIPPTTTVASEHIAVFVRPVIGEGGKDFSGRIILVDQLKRKHPTDKITFKWVGLVEPPKYPSVPSPVQNKPDAAADLAEYGGEASKLHE